MEIFKGHFPEEYNPGTPVTSELICNFMIDKIDKSIALYKKIIEHSERKVGVEWHNDSGFPWNSVTKMFGTGSGNILDSDPMCSVFCNSGHMICPIKMINKEDKCSQHLQVAIHSGPCTRTVSALKRHVTFLKTIRKDMVAIKRRPIEIKETKEIRLPFPKLESIAMDWSAVANITLAQPPSSYLSTSISGNITLSDNG
jgi:hypothetical protein